MINAVIPEAIVPLFLAGLNAEDLTAFRRMCVDDLIVHAPLAVPEDIRGLDRLAALLQVYRSAFPDGQFTEETMDPAADLIPCGWTARGTHRGLFLHVPPTNKEVVVRGTCRFRLAEGLVSEIWFDFDLYSIFEQIGALLPEPGHAPLTSLDICEAAFEAWKEALLGRRRYFDGAFSDDVAVHARCFELVACDSGRAALGQILGLVHAMLADIQISVNRSMSQGLTTTYTGLISGKLSTKSEREEFRLYCMFRTQGEKVAGFWFQLLRK